MADEMQNNDWGDLENKLKEEWEAASDKTKEVWDEIVDRVTESYKDAAGWTDEKVEQAKDYFKGEYADKMQNGNEDKDEDMEE